MLWHTLKLLNFKDLSSNRPRDFRHNSRKHWILERVWAKVKQIHRYLLRDHPKLAVQARASARIYFC
jgi:hypothetical protein